MSPSWLVFGMGACGGAVAVLGLMAVCGGVHRRPETVEDLQVMLPYAAIELVAERREVVIYTGWTVDDDRSTLIDMSHEPEEYWRRRAQLEERRLREARRARE